MPYKHTQISYLMIIITLAMLAFFAWTYSMAVAEPPSVDSWPNLAVTSTMIIIIFILASFTTLQVKVDEKHLQIKFGYGIYQRKFAIDEIQSVKRVKNKRYYGRWIRIRFRPKMLIYNVAGFDAVQIQLKSGKIYRIGTDEPQKLEQVISQKIK